MSAQNRFFRDIVPTGRDALRYARYGLCWIGEVQECKMKLITAGQ